MAPNIKANLYRHISKALASSYLTSLTQKGKCEKLTAEVRASRIADLRNYAEGLREKYRRELLDKLAGIEVNDHTTAEAKTTREHVTTELQPLTQSLARIEASLGISQEEEAAEPVPMDKDQGAEAAAAMDAAMGELNINDEKQDQNMAQEQAVHEEPQSGLDNEVPIAEEKPNESDAEGLEEDAPMNWHKVDAMVEEIIGWVDANPEASRLTKQQKLTEILNPLTVIDCDKDDRWIQTADGKRWWAQHLLLHFIRKSESSASSTAAPAQQ